MKSQPLPEEPYRNPSEQSKRDAAAADLKASLRSASATNETIAPQEVQKVIDDLPKLVPMTESQDRARQFTTDIAPRLKRRGFEDRFLVDGFVAQGDKRTGYQKATLEELKKYIRATGAIVTLCGPRGLGKTTIATQLAIERDFEDWATTRRKGPTMCRDSVYRKATDIVARLKCIYGDFGSINTGQAENYQSAIIRPELLVIDEWQEAGEDSRLKDRIVTDIIDRRYSAKRDTIIITNQTEKEFRETTNSSIIDRLGEHGKIIECAWGSFREK